MLQHFSPENVFKKSIFVTESTFYLNVLLHDRFICLHMRIIAASTGHFLTLKNFDVDRNRILTLFQATICNRMKSFLKLDFISEF